MKTNRTFSIQFLDESIVSGLTYEESDQAMKDSEGTENPWTRVFVDPSEYKPC